MAESQFPTFFHWIARESIFALPTRAVSFLPGKAPVMNIPDLLASSEFWGLPPDKRHEYTRTAVEPLVLRTAAEYAEQPLDQREEYLENLIKRAERLSSRFSGIRPPPSARQQNSRRDLERSFDRSWERPEGGGSSQRAERALERVRQEAERFDATSRAQVLNFMMDLRRHLENR